MWTAKIKVVSEKMLVGEAAQKVGIDVYGYPISFHKKGNRIISFVVGELIGEEEDIALFVKLMRKNKRVKNIEVKNNFMSCLISDPRSVEKFYNYHIIYTKPLFISRDGYEIYNVASWSKGELMKFVGLFEKKYNGELLRLKQEKISNISVMAPFPDMTEKQKKALDLAIEEGYFDYPRRVDVKTLAKEAGLAFSTFQVHLRKAENKIIGFYKKFR